MRWADQLCAIMAILRHALATIPYMMYTRHVSQGSVSQITDHMEQRNYKQDVNMGREGQPLSVRREDDDEDIARSGWF